MSEKSKLADKYENTKNFTEEETNNITELQQTFIDIQSKFGQLSVAKIRIQQQIEKYDKYEDQLNKDFLQMQKDESKFMKELNEKYGEGSYNPETNEFTSNKSK